MQIKIILIAVALVLAGCAGQMQEPTTEATEVDRIVLAQNSPLGSACRRMAPNTNPGLPMMELTDKCQCVEDYAITNMDGRVVAWLVQQSDMWNRPLPAWAERRVNMDRLITDGFAACGLKGKTG